MRATRPELEALLDKAMSKLPEDRFQTAAELAAALAATPEGKAAGQEIGVARPPRPEARRRAAKADRQGRRRTAARPRRQAPAGARAGATVRQDAKTTIDTVSAVRRRLAANDAGAGARRPPVRQFRLAWIGALFVVVALLALLIGRGLRSQRRRRDRRRRGAHPPPRRPAAAGRTPPAAAAPAARRAESPRWSRRGR